MSDSLCPTCAHVRRIQTPRGSTFFFCERWKEGGYAKYPPQPVVACKGYEMNEVGETEVRE